MIALALLLPLAPILAMLAARRTAKRDHEKMMTTMRGPRVKRRTPPLPRTHPIA